MDGGSGDGAGGRTPRASAIKMMETMKTFAPTERIRGSVAAAAARPTPPSPAPAAACKVSGVQSLPADTQQLKRKQVLTAPTMPPSAPAAAQEPAVKRRRPQGSSEVTVLEWLEAEAEKRPIDQSTPMLPPGIEPPQRPHSASLLFMHKIKGRIKQPPSGAWTPKQLAQGVTRLFEALPPAHQEQYRSAAKESMDTYKAELSRLRPVGSKTLEICTADQKGLRGAPSAFKVFERNVIPRLRHSHPTKPEEELVALCKKEWAGISEKEKRTYQVLLISLNQLPKFPETFDVVVMGWGLILFVFHIPPYIILLMK